MQKIALSTASVLAVIYIVPIVVYGIFSAVFGLKTPGGSPMLFLVSVFVSKLGTAIAFVLIFYFSRNSFGGNWFLYAFLWWLMYVIGEVGQGIGPDYSWKEAIAGIISETIYFPVSAYIVNWFFRV
jgi:hypothetical protein